MIKSLPYENATSGESALVDVQKILAKFGCSQFGTMQDVEKGETILQFRHRGKDVSLIVSWRGYATAFLKTHPYSRRTRMSETVYQKRALEKGKIAVCSILRDWVKAQITAVEVGMMTFDAVFMPHILLPTGKRIVDFIKEQKLLPDQQ